MRRRRPPESRIPGWLMLIPCSILTCACLSVFFFLIFMLYRDSAAWDSKVIDCFNPDFQVCKTKASNVLIAVMSNDEFYKTRAKIANNTWVARARDLGIQVIFFGTSFDPDLPAVGLAPEDASPEEILSWKGVVGRGNNKRVFTMFGYLRDTNFEGKKFIMKVDDDTFVHPDNLLGLLCDKSWNELHYIGENTENKYSFAGGGAGYLLSSDALLLILDARESQKCKDEVAEDVTIGICARQLGIPLTKDHRFHFFSPKKPGALHSDFISYHHMKEQDVKYLNSIAFKNCGGL